MNDITPPKRTMSEVVSQTEQIPATSTNVGQPKKRRTRLFVFLTMLAVVVAAASYFGWQTWNNRKYPPKGTYAVVGSQSESQKNFDEITAAYVKFDQQSAAGKAIDAKKVERRAADEVILRLGLQDEAKKRSKLDCTPQKVDEIMKDRYDAAGGRSEFYAQLKNDYGWTEQVTAHQECLEYYKSTLQDDLIAGHELFGVYVRWDVALGQPEDIKASVERKAVDKLTNEFLPLFQVNKSDKEIAAKADVNETTSDDEFTTKVTSTDNPASRVIQLARFNDEVYKAFQQYAEGEDETKYVDKLEQGGYTNVFKSKTGYYVIYRSTKKFTGSYVSYDQMLSKVLETAKVSKSYASLPKADKAAPKPQESDKGLSWVSRLLSGALRAVTPRAEAATPNSIACYGDSHKLPFSVEYRDAATKSIIQSNTGQIKISSTGDIQTPCKDEPAAGTNIYGVNVAYNQGKITYTTGIHPNPWDFGLTCYTSWRFDFGAPTGYEGLTSADYANKNRFYLKVDYASSSYAGYTASSTSGQYQIPPQYYAGIANGAKGFTIRVYFTKKPAVGDLKLASKIKQGSATTYSAGLPAGVNPSAFLCSSLQGATPPSTLSCPTISSPSFSATRGSTPTGVYDAAHAATLTGNWNLTKVEAVYPDDCLAHKKGVVETFQTSKVAVRICEGQTPVVTFYFTDQVAATSYGPWLQAKGGNVLALGKITGQVKTIPGGSGSTAEAEYVVMTVASSNFCAGYNLGLTTSSASCSYDPGYSPYRSYPQGGDDPVIKGVTTALAGQSGGPECSRDKPYIISSTMTTDFQNSNGFGATTGCPVIGTVTSDSYSANHSFKQGRATIYNKPPSGTLTITANNVLNYVGTYSSINEIPNVGLIVDGDVVIGPDVTQLDMSIYASGTIKTCSTYPSPTCNKQLKVRGVLAAAKGFIFGRNYKDGGPAELVVGSGLTEAFPPPGFIDLFSKNVVGVKYLTTQGNPRF